MSDPAQFNGFHASELYCPKCRRSQPVREHLLLVLPTGNKYDYRCAACGTAVGEREDGDRREFDQIRSAASTTSPRRRQR